MNIMKNQTSTPTNPELFFGFLKLGMIGFGGVLPLTHRLVVEEKHWLNQAEFTNLLGVCQILPGGNAVNMSVAIGMHFQGIKGAFSAISGLICVPTLCVILLYSFYEKFQAIAWVQHLILGLAATAAGLLLATGIKLFKPLIKSKLSYLTVALIFILMVGFKLSLLLTLIILLSLNMLILKVKT
ncbi:chromate transporter [Acinetobacter sp. MD2]|uniref:chromate transporter n=1 Tax=Acinetobacter sp. MD2 TaxID=2600066 RepID=UPI002D1E4EDB|nr:chromate transporter [Acinetobacter sp. MD2]